MDSKLQSNKRQMIVLLFPGLLIFGVFTIYPIAKLFLMSFFQWDFGSMLDQEFIGFSNYKDVLSDSFFWMTFANTLAYTFITVPAQMLLGLLVAVLIHEIKRLQVFFRVMHYLPVITSWVIVSLVFRYIFNTEGLLNYFLNNTLNVVDGNIRWLDSRWSALSVAMLLGIWKGVGWNMVIFLAALQQVPSDLYEAAEIDGCNAFLRFFTITLPSIRGTILFAWIMLTIGGFNVFTSIKMITGGGPAHQTDTMLTWMYYKAFSTGKLGYSASLSFMMALTLGLLAFFQFKAMKDKDMEAKNLK
ncbi:MAG: sugar ABC transporter permease [Sphaerochaeta sp.]|nr:sugar ABC transporter permease [Sphaerochaeta sp.]